MLDAELLALGKWISGYYCAPLGEVLRGMLPVASDIRRGKVYSLTDAGRDAPDGRCCAPLSNGLTGSALVQSC